MSSGFFFTAGTEMPLKKEDQLRLINILDLARSNAETTKTVSEIATKNLVATENSATATE